MAMLLFLQLSKFFTIAALAVPKITYIDDVVYDSKGRRPIGIQVGVHLEPPKPALSGNKIGRVHSERIQFRKVSIPRRTRAPTLGAFGFFGDPVIVKASNVSSKAVLNV